MHTDDHKMHKSILDVCLTHKFGQIKFGTVFSVTSGKKNRRENIKMLNHL